MLIRISHRSYRAYSYSEVPVRTTKLILVLRILYLYYGAYPCLTELILVLLSLFLYFGSYTCITGHILVLRILYLYYETCSYAKVPVGSYWFISPEGNIFVLISYSYTYTCTYPYHRHILIKSLVGVIELLCVRRYP